MRAGLQDVADAGAVVAIEPRLEMAVPHDALTYPYPGDSYADAALDGDGAYAAVLACLRVAYRIPERKMPRLLLLARGAAHSRSRELPGGRGEVLARAHPVACDTHRLERS
jgi:hypothetical protein